MQGKYHTEVITKNYPNVRFIEINSDKTLKQFSISLNSSINSQTTTSYEISK